MIQFDIKKDLKNHYLFKENVFDLVNTLTTLIKHEISLRKNKPKEFSKTILNVSDMIVYKYFNENISFHKSAFLKSNKLKSFPFSIKINELELEYEFKKLKKQNIKPITQNIMARFKKGQTVFDGRGDKIREMVVARVIKHPMLPIHQYSFEAPYDGFACGEQSIRGHKYGEDLKLSDCFEKDNTAIKVNTIMSAKRNTVNFEEYGLGSVYKDCNLFFKPDLDFVEWLRDYADGRLIIDVGSGQGHLVRMLKMVKARAIGIEPNFDKREWIKWKMQHNNGSFNDFDINEILQGTVQQHKNIINGLKDKAILVFARPCHSDFVETGIYNMPNEMEALYITVPENFNRYNDLGGFKNKATLIEHKGVSEDNEVVYSIKK